MGPERTTAVNVARQEYAGHLLKSVFRLKNMTYLVCFEPHTTLYMQKMLEVHGRCGMLAYGDKQTPTTLGD